jgi:hypothetical protein
MVRAGVGLTATYDALADLTRTEPELDALRELHLALDRAVLDAYGWTDVEVPAWGRRGALERPVVDRLYELNRAGASPPS